MYASMDVHVDVYIYVRFSLCMHMHVVYACVYMHMKGVPISNLVVRFRMTASVKVRARARFG